MSYVVVLLSLMVFSFQLSAHTNHTSLDPQFTMEPYLLDCGGKIYSECDDQVKVYNDALNFAKEHDKQILLVFGADWCPACRQFNKMIHEDAKAFENFTSKYLIVEINGDIKSANEIEKSLNVVVAGYPSAFLIDKESQKSIAQTYPSQFSTLEKLTDFLEAKFPIKTLSELDVAIAQIQFLGNASIQLANRPIEIELKNNMMAWVQASSQTDSFSAYLNQGVAFLHVFHYIDALRSFKMARELDSNSLYPITGMILSYLNLSPEEGTPFIEQLLLQAKELKSKASQREVLWYQLAVSIYRTQTGSFSKLIDPDLKSIVESYNELLNYDPNDIETLTLATFVSGINNAKESYLKALTINPTHTGANHYLVHYFESIGESSKSVEMGKIVAETASFNGHAVHMYGHILPEVGRWNEAKEKFLETDRLHKDWARRNEVEPSEDWNYAHNLHLLAVTQFGVGEVDLGIKNLSEACQYDGRACLHLYGALLAFSKIENTESEIDKLIKGNPGWKEYVQDLIDEIALIKGTPFSTLSFKSQESAHLKFISEIVNAKNMSVEDKKVWLEKISLHIQSNFPQHGFDSWSSGLLNSIRLLAAAARVQDQETYDAILVALKVKANEFGLDLYTYINP